ncbi:hypothetical protein GQ231_002618 [Salmonella enterica]|nr:hypothetical protein [Salmonella enterica]
MLSYKQQVKEESRNKIWSRAIKKLTKERKNQYIIKKEYIKNLWNYSFNEILKNTIYDKKTITSWVDFSDTLNIKKNPNQLKIAYFCGPEPENDLDILIKLGVKVENVWAIEADKKTYQKAIESVRIKYPTLKIFNGDISDLVKAISFKFDIIYLDFTAPLISSKSKPLLKINSIFEHHALEDLGILIINGALPENNSDNVDFLASYFRSQTFLESPIITGDDTNVYYTEGSDAQGLFTDEEIAEITKSGECDWIDENDSFNKKIKENFASTYSAFCTHYPAMVASYAQPIHNVSTIPSLKRMFFKTDIKTIKNCLERIATPSDKLFKNIDYDKLLSDDEYAKKVDLTGSELYEQHQEFPIWSFISRLSRSKNSLSSYWNQQFNKKNDGCLSLESIQLYDLLKTAHYSYKSILSDTLSNSIEEIMEKIPDRHGGIFCDVPMPHLWMELALNHLGGTYHINTKQHWRAKYKAKEHEMYLDMFVFDKCRALYDWLPMLDLYGTYISAIERQIIVRSCMDAIKKQCHYSFFDLYFGSHLIGIHTKEWSGCPNLKIRHNLNNPNEK